MSEREERNNCDGNCEICPERYDCPDSPECLDGPGEWQDEDGAWHVNGE